MRLGEKIRLLRKQNGWSQVELGKKIGLDGKQICRYEREAIKPSINTLKKLADVFRVTTDFLISENGEKIKNGLDIEDKELYIYCQAVDKLPYKEKNAIKIVLRKLVMSG